MAYGPFVYVHLLFRSSMVFRTRPVTSGKLPTQSVYLASTVVPLATVLYRMGIVCVSSMCAADGLSHNIHPGLEGGEENDIELSHE